MSFILGSVRPSNLQNWIAVNAAGSLKNTAKESWRAYLIAQGAVGQSIQELERSYNTGQAGNLQSDKWGTRLTATAGGSAREKARNFYK